MKKTRNTAQRRAILSVVERLDDSHPTASEVFSEVRQAHPKLSLATVYRNLEACSGFQVESGPMQFYGTCPLCRA